MLPIRYVSIEQILFLTPHPPPPPPRARARPEDTDAQPSPLPTPYVTLTRKVLCHPVYRFPFTLALVQTVVTPGDTVLSPGILFSQHLLSSASCCFAQAQCPVWRKVSCTIRATCLISGYAPGLGRTTDIAAATPPSQANSTSHTTPPPPPPLRLSPHSRCKRDEAHVQTPKYDVARELFLMVTVSPVSAHRSTWQDSTSIQGVQLVPHACRGPGE